MHDYRKRTSKMQNESSHRWDQITEYLPYGINGEKSSHSAYNQFIPPPHM
jgi:hypothetical protein